MASFLMPYLGGGLTIMALPPEFLASPTLELLAGRVVTIPFDGSAMVEGTVCPTTVSSPDADIRGALAAGLEKSKEQIKTCKSTTKSTRLQNY